MKPNDYPADTKSLVAVTFTDGEVKVYPISASPSVSGHLTRQISEGALNLYARGIGICIPAVQIRSVEITAYDPDAVVEPSA